jgi:hypothetical protein
MLNAPIDAGSPFGIPPRAQSWLPVETEDLVDQDEWEIYSKWYVPINERSGTKLRRIRPVSLTTTSV